jgi:hypothetical protein
MTKNETISAMILALVENGVSPVDALRAVCGSEVVDAMISDIYDELRKEGK